MNKEQQRIAIAEACGWTDTPIVDGKYGQTDVPDFLTDLNAMHEVVKIFFYSKPASEGWVYLKNLQHVAEICHSSVCLRLVEATAAQRAEAFLRTINKWTTEPTPEQ